LLLETLKLKKHILKIIKFDNKPTQMKYSLIVTLLLTIYSCSSQNLDCSKFKTGTFVYVDSNNQGTKIIRNDSIQIESNDKNDIKIVTTVKWASDCEYVLTYKDIENYPKKDQIIGKKINVKIIGTKNDTYICHATSDAIDSKIKFIKISN